MRPTKPGHGKARSPTPFQCLWRSPAPTRPSPRNVEQIGPYVLQNELGAGAMGKVYLGHRQGEERQLAIKVLHSDVSRNADALKRFQREAKIAYALRHPNIMEVLDQGCDGDSHYIVMDYIPGPDLQVRIDRAEFPPWEQSVRWTIALLQALQHAHDQGVIHRDIKPANVLLDQDQEVLLTDFGVAKFREGTRLTSEGALIGTPEYMAPELFQNTEVDAKVDVYGCALILYELLTRHHPFRGSSITETIKSVLFKPLERPHHPEVPPAINDLLLQALARNPEERPSAGQLAQRLHQALLEPTFSTPLPKETAIAPPEDSGILVARSPAAGDRLTLNSILKRSRAEALHWDDEMVVAVFATPQKALECLSEMAREMTLERLPRRVVVTGPFLPDDKLSQVHPNLGELACATVVKAVDKLNSLENHQLRLCERTAALKLLDFPTMEAESGWFTFKTSPSTSTVSISKTPRARPKLLGEGEERRSRRSGTMTIPPAPKPRRNPWPWLGLLLILGGSYPGWKWYQRQPGTLTIACQPDKVQLKLDNVKKGLYQKGQALKLKAGEHSLALSAQGFEPWQGKVTVPPAGKVEVNAKLTRKKKSKKGAPSGAEH